MRLPIKVWVGEGEKRERVDAILWIDEVPPEYRRGRNRRMKSRKYKQERQEHLKERGRGRRR